MFFQRLIHGSLAFIVLFALTGAAVAASVNFSGEVTYLERIKLPADAQLVVTLVALPDARPIVSAAASIAAPGRVPLQYSLNLDGSLIAANRQYGLVAEIRSTEGTLFRNNVPVPVDPAMPGPTTIVVSFNANPQPDQIVSVPPVVPAVTAPRQPAAAPPAQPPVVETPPAQTEPEPQPAALPEIPTEPVAPTEEAPAVIAETEPVAPPETAVVEADPTEAPAPQEPANPLLDTAWRVIGIGGDPVLTDTKVTLALAGDGRATGTGGCNNFFAEAGFHTMPLFFGPVASTRMACEPAIMAQESAYFAALDTVVSYELAGNSLSLLNALAVPVIELTRE